MIGKEEINEYRNDYRLISVQMKGGRLTMRIYADTPPGNGFTPVQPILEDVYFYQISHHMDVITL